MSESYGSTLPDNPFEGWSQEEVEAHFTRLREQDKQWQAAARARLPEFSGEDASQKIIDAYTFMFGLCRKTKDALRPTVYLGVLDDLRAAYPEVLTHEVTGKIYDSYSQESAISES